MAAREAEGPPETALGALGATAGAAVRGAHWLPPGESQGSGSGGFMQEIQDRILGDGLGCKYKSPLSLGAGEPFQHPLPGGTPSWSP